MKKIVFLKNVWLAEKREGKERKEDSLLIFGWGRGRDDEGSAFPQGPLSGFLLVLEGKGKKNERKRWHALLLSLLLEADPHL